METGINKEIEKVVKIIYCVDCGNPRPVYSPNFKQVTRCKICYYDHKRKYNSEYQKKHRQINEIKNQLPKD